MRGRLLGPAMAALFLLSLAASGPLLLPSRGSAEMWCADPLWVHEWGVQVFGASGATRGSAGTSLPPYFNRRGPQMSTAMVLPVRLLPPDGGERELPIVHFYAPGNFRPVPVGFDVGFAHGEASSWYPQVDFLFPAAATRSAPARRGRAAILRQRQQRQANPPRLGTQAQPVLPDPTRQLHWDRIELAAQPAHARAQSSLPWVSRLRSLPALWLNHRGASERFLFYEGRTTERPALALARGTRGGPHRRHLLIRNTGAHAVHEVFLIHREGRRSYVFYAPSIPAGSHAGLILEDHAVRGQARFRERTRTRLARALTDPQAPAAPQRYSWGGPNGCTMQRDPALPVEQSAGHLLYAAEVDALLDIWSPRFFEAQGTTLLYREDTAYLDAEMPVSVYTDMYHFVVLRRLGLALMENVALP